MKKTYLSLLVAVSEICFSAGAVEINDLRPGMLAGELSASATNEIENLKLAGDIDVRDLLVAAELPALVSLDLTNTKIAAYTPDKPLPLVEGDFAADYLPAGIFFGKHLRELKLPSTLMVIGSYSLAGNDFTAVVLPEGLGSIDDYAFYDCDKLNGMVLPASVMSVGRYSFAGCDALASVDMSVASVTCLPDYMFLNSEVLADVKLPSSLTEIGIGVFAGCTALKDVSLPSSLDEIGVLSFAHSGLNKVNIPQSVDYIDDFAFSRCNEMVAASVASADTGLGEGVFFYSKALRDVTADGLDEIPDYTFAGNSALPYASLAGMDNVKSIGSFALLDTQAETITLPSTLVYLSDGALEGVTGLKKIDASALGDRVPELGKNVFAGINQGDVELLVAEDTGDIWKSAPQWNEFKINSPAGINGTQASASIVKAWFEGRELSIVAPDEIESVSVYLSNGAKAFHVEPYSSHVSIDTSGFSDRVYIVEITAGEGRSVFKLLR